MLDVTNNSIRKQEHTLNNGVSGIEAHMPTIPKSNLGYKSANINNPGNKIPKNNQIHHTSLLSYLLLIGARIMQRNDSLLKSSARHEFSTWT